MSLGDARVIGWSGGSEKYFVDLIPPIFHYEDFSADPFSLDASDFANIYGVPKSYLDKSGFDPSTGSVRMSNTVTALESQSYIRKSIVKETVFNQYTGGITRVYKTTAVSTGENALVTDDSIDFYYRKFLDSRDNLKIYTFYRTLYTYSEVEEEIIIDGGADESFSWTYYLTATRLVRKVLNRQVKCY